MSDPTQPNGSGQDPQDAPAPKYVTEEQLNRAITARFADFQKKSEKGMAEAFGKFEALLTEKLSAAPVQTPKDEPKGESPEVAGLKKQLADMQTSIKAANDKAEAERAKARDTSLRQKLQDSLVANGVDAKNTRAAIALLVDGDKRVSWNDDSDELVFRDSDNQLVDLATGLKSWAKSDDAKIYLSPRGSVGSGSAPGSGSAQRAPSVNQPGSALPPGELGRYVMSLAAGIPGSGVGGQ